MANRRSGEILGLASRVSSLGKKSLGSSVPCFESDNSRLRTPNSEPVPITRDSELSVCELCPSISLILRSPSSFEFPHPSISLRMTLSSVEGVRMTLSSVEGVRMTLSNVEEVRVVRLPFEGLRAVS